jgi:Uma2 family endonuclease
MVVAEAEALMTVEDFWEFVALPENQDQRFELDNGLLIEISPSRPFNSITAMRVAAALGNFVYPRDLGYITGPDGGYRVGPRKVRQPDVGYISKARLPGIPARFEIAPDLAVEIVSPDEDVLKKARDYLAAGTKAVWGVYSDEREVAVIRLGADGKITVEILGIDATLTCEDVLPGFALPVRDIFPQE